jgi:hypothetical protein
MKRVYIAGPYSGDNVISILDNIRRGMRAATECFLQGHAPFCPWLDFHYQLMLRENETLLVEDYYKYSIAWLAVSDGVWILPNSEKSKGVQKEVKIAKILNIPIVQL